MKLNEIGLRDSTSIIAQRSILLESPVAGVSPRILETSRAIYFIGSSTDVFKFPLDDAGREQAQELKRAWRRRGGRAALRRSYAGFKTTMASSARISSYAQITPRTLPRTARLVGSAAFRAFFKFLQYWNVADSLRDGMIFNIASYEQDFQDGVIDETEFQDRVQVAYGVFAAAIAPVILSALRAGIRSIIRILRNIRRAIQARSTAALFTGAGTVPGIVTLIGSQVAYMVIARILTSAYVQGKFTDWIIEWGQSSVFGAIFQGGVETAGTLLQAAAAALDAATNGLIGSPDLFSALGGTEAMGGEAYTKTITEIPGLEGSAFATQEWAKLVFQDLLFPPGTSVEDKLVPYMDREMRENRMAEVFGKFTAPVEEVEGDVEGFVQPGTGGPRRGSAGNSARAAKNREDAEREARIADLAKQDAADRLPASTNTVVGGGQWPVTIDPPEPGTIPAPN